MTVTCPNCGKDNKVAGHHGGQDAATQEAHRVVKLLCGYCGTTFEPRRPDGQAPAR